MSFAVITGIVIYVLACSSYLIVLRVIIVRGRALVDDECILKQYTVDSSCVNPGPACGDIDMESMVSATELPRRRVESSVRRLQKIHLVDRYVNLETGQVRVRLTMVGRFKLAPRRGLGLRRHRARR